MAAEVDARLPDGHTSRVVFSPSDAPPPYPYRLGGRVVARDGAGLVIADAFAELRVMLAASEEDACSVGQIVEVELVEADPSGAPLAATLVVVGGDARGGLRAGGERARLQARDRAIGLRRRAELISVVRAFFCARGYLEVETPALVPSPGMDLHLDAFRARDAHGDERDGDERGRDEHARFLITSPEYQMKRLLAGGMPRIFQIARCFRPREVGARHNPEFTMLEWYRTHAGVESMIAETEALVVEVARAARGRAELIAHDASGRSARTIELSPPFERLPIARAFARHTALDEEGALALALSGRAEDEERFYRLLVDEVEPRLAEGPPVVLVDYPTTQASLARKKPGDPRVAERFELFVGGVELCNGFGELVDPHEQRARFLEDQRSRRVAGKAVLPIDERFLSALEEGLPPSTGNALGLDRLIQLALGAPTIADVLAFPDGPEGWL